MNAFKDKDFIQYSDKKVKEETKNLTLYFIVHITLYVVLFFFLLFFAWYTVFITTHKFYAVKGVSMMPTLNSEITEDEIMYDPDVQQLSYDAVYVDKSTKPRLFDIVVVEYSKTNSVIKRLMATEGDYITIAKGTTTSGDECFYFYRIPKGTDLASFSDEHAKLDEMSGQNGYTIRGYEDWYKNKATSSQPPKTISTSSGTNEYEYNFYYKFLSEYQEGDDEFYTSPNGLVYVKVPDGKRFFMGDNRGHSTDSRENGFVDKEKIVGRAEFIVENYTFVNRILEVVKFYFSEMEKFFAR